MAAVGGQGVVSNVEPGQGSEGGGTEIHIVGAGFGHAVAVTVGGQPALVQETHTKDGEILAYTPPRAEGADRAADVVVWFESGHRANWRGGPFMYQERATPFLQSVSAAVPALGNVTFRGDLRQRLAGNQQRMFELLGERRNATEVMHAFLGSGENIFGATGGVGEFRCDLLETPDQHTGICEVRAGTPAGHYNLSYVLEDGRTGSGFGKALSDVPKFLNRQGQPYEIEIMPSIYGVSISQSGRLGGASVVVEADSLEPGRGDFHSRHHVLLDGVPCEVTNVVRRGSKDLLTCVTGSTEQRPSFWPEFSSQPALGESADAWRAAHGVGLAPARPDTTASGGQARTFNISDYLTLEHESSRCSNQLDSGIFGAFVKLEECAEHCFMSGVCSYFDFAPAQTCHMCVGLSGDDSEDQRAELIEASADSSSVYHLAVTGQEYLEEYPEGPTWRLVSARHQCVEDHASEEARHLTMDHDGGSHGGGSTGLIGASVQTCADLCAMYRMDGASGGKCTHFGFYRDQRGSRQRCILYRPQSQPACEEYMDGLRESELGNEPFPYPRYSTYELTKPVPHSPQISGIFPGGRGVLFRVWNMCPRENSFNLPCSHSEKMSREPFSALYASVNPDYAAQRPMFEGVRRDQLRGPFGSDVVTDYEMLAMASQLAFDPAQVPFATLRDAQSEHGLVTELLGFFRAPYTANYSFIVYGTGSEYQSDMWVSASDDPTDLVQVAEALWRTQRRGQQMQIFDDVCGKDGTTERHRGRPLDESHAFRGDPEAGRYSCQGGGLDSDGVYTPTRVTLSLQAGERRFFVKRVPVSPGDELNLEGTAVRIHNPDLSRESPAMRESIAQRQSWPEVVEIRRQTLLGKAGGTWRICVRHTDRQLHCSHDLEGDWTQTGPDEIRDAFESIVLPWDDRGRGGHCECDVWDMSSTEDSEVGGRSSVQLVIRKPVGNVPNLVIERDMMRTDVEAFTIAHGKEDDLLLFPIPGDLLEVPASEPQAQLAAVGIPAMTADPMQESASAVDGTMYFDYEETLPENDAGVDGSGCEFGETFSSATAALQILDSAEIYSSWRDCKWRCCHDERCQAAAYDDATQMCSKLGQPLETPLEASDGQTSLVANVLGRGEAPDGWASTPRAVNEEGLPIEVFQGHRSVGFCKAQCNADHRCRSFAWHETHGCVLKTQCVPEEHQMVAPGSSAAEFRTFYQRLPRGPCHERGDFPEEWLDGLLFVEGLADSSTLAGPVTKVIPFASMYGSGVDVDGRRNVWGKTRKHATSNFTEGLFPDPSGAGSSRRLRPEGAETPLPEAAAAPVHDGRVGARPRAADVDADVWRDVVQGRDPGREAGGGGQRRR
jgi:hypothetical protein